MDMTEALTITKNKALNTLEELIRTYNHIDDTPRMDKSAFIFDNIRDYLTLIANTAYPQLEKRVTPNALQQSKNLYEEIDTLLEHTVMLHVDQPECEYYDDLVRLQALFETYCQFSEKNFYTVMADLQSEGQLKQVEAVPAT